MDRPPRWVLILILLFPPAWPVAAYLLYRWITDQSGPAPVLGRRSPDRDSLLDEELLLLHDDEDDPADEPASDAPWAPDDDDLIDDLLLFDEDDSW